MTEKQQELNLFQKIADVKANIDGFTKDAKELQLFICKWLSSITQN